MVLGIILAFVFLSAGLLSYTVIPFVTNQVVVLSQKRNEKFANKMERVLIKSDIKKMSQLYFLAPVVLAVVAFFIFPTEIRLFGVLIGLILGFIIPSIYIKILIGKRKTKFNNQLIDALMIMSSSFRGGLSLVQAMEAVVEEMPDPIDQEFGTVLSENKMGVSLEEALNHLYQRMPSPALQQTMTAILLARETGGNLPAIFVRIVNTIREHNKIRQNIETLTLQGKIQGIVMSILPVGFAFIVYSSSPQFFDHMVHSELGRTMLIYAFFSEIIGAFFIWKISTFKDF